MTIKETKAAQGYTAQPVLPVCGTCAAFRSEMVLPEWMRNMNQGRDASGLQGHYYTAEIDGTEKNLRCSVGGFAVKKMAACNQWRAKTEGDAA